VKVIPGSLLGPGLAIFASYLSKLISMDLLGLPHSPVSPVMMAILLY